MSNAILPYTLSSVALGFSILLNTLLSLIQWKRRSDAKKNILKSNDDLERPLLTNQEDPLAHGNNGQLKTTDELKDNVQHWTKMLLYFLEANFEGAILLYYVLDDPVSSKSRWIPAGLFMLSWLSLCFTETVHFQISAKGSSLYQLLSVALAAAGSVATFFAGRNDGPLGANEIELYNVIVLGLIIGVEIYSFFHPPRNHSFHYLNVEYSAGLWSYFNFNWFSPMITVGYKRPLEPSDLPIMIDNDRSSQAYKVFSKTIYKNGPQNIIEGIDLKIGIGILRMAGKRVYLQGFWALLSVILSSIPVLSMHELTDYLSSYGDPQNQKVSSVMLICIGGLLFSQVLSAYADSMMFKLGRRIGMRAKCGIISAVFRKALALDAGSIDAGKLQNHIAVDAESVLNFCVFQMFMVGAVFRLFICIGLLIYYLGLSSLGGIGLLIVTVPLNNIILKNLKKFQKILMTRRDARMTIVYEAMQGIRIIKLFAWENKFLRKISDARSLEVAILRSYMFMLGCFMVVVKSSPSLVSVVTFIVHTQIFGKTLSASTGFTSLALFNLLRTPLIVLPTTINDYIQARISYKRINDLLRSKKLDVRNVMDDYESPYLDSAVIPDGSIQISNGYFQWQSSSFSELPVLKSISLDVKPGQLVCVYGPTGCGKSSLLMAILQELKIVQGTLNIRGSKSYAAQKAWIQNATVRDNILFGNPFIEDRYEQVLNVCALKSDLALFEAGDMTEIGERGINLSGGQQQRVSLARAVYNDSSIVLLDDVLSAVDAHVGRHIFNECVDGFLKGRTVILVTHQVSLTAPKADQIIIFNSDGSLRESGTYVELSQKSDGYLDKIRMTTLEREREASNASDASEDKGRQRVIDIDGTKEKTDAKRGLLISKEAHAQGNPKLSLYARYFHYCGGRAFGTVSLTISLLWQALTVAQSFYLKQWINEMSSGIQNGSGYKIYLIVSAAAFFAVMIRTVLIIGGSVQASKKVHDSMSNSVFGAPICWFDSTPLGRIFNRFSSDIVTLDKDLMNDIISYGDMVLGVIGVVAGIVFAIPWLIIAMLPILGLCYWYGNIYLQSSRQLKRLEAVHRSPLYAHFSESVAGASTIRAYCDEARFIRTNEELVDKLNRCFFHLWISNYWLSTRIRVIGSFICGIVGIFIIADAENLDGRLCTAGLVLSYVLQFTVAVVFTVRLHAQMEMSVNSIERLDEYCTLKQEAPPIIPDKRPPREWPFEGKVEISNLYLKYASSSEPVLHGITFNVEPRTSVGIVGRTGAGKSSLTNALFRIVEPLPGSTIKIDGINVLDIGLQDLRRSIAIIPQEPTLFKGTIRGNIDPFEEYNDMDVWEALRQCHLYDFVNGTEGKLSYEITASGSNLSVGQRQLMCMARALLRKSVIMVMDEATANVDTETDAAIQDTMRKSFGTCTVLCIAHRLHTVVHYDMILVLESGRVAEYDTPTNLLEDKNSRFYSMCKETGDFGNLLQMVKTSPN